MILFTAHSVPMKTVNKGDAYTAEVCATVAGVMAQPGLRRFARAVPSVVAASGTSAASAGEQ